jgi:ferritin-like metal-binding protein YciE
MPNATPKPFDTAALQQVFIHNLNRIYFGKCYLDQHLSHLITLASFPALQLAMEEFWEDVRRQIQRMHAVYELMGITPSDKNCNPIRSIVKDNFCIDEEQDMLIFTDTDIIAYVQVLEHINITACRMLKMIASLLKNEKAEQLLTECFDESIDNDHLFELISQEYFVAHR